MKRFILSIVVIAVLFPVSLYGYVGDISLERIKIVDGIKSKRKIFLFFTENLNTFIIKNHIKFTPSVGNIRVYLTDRRKKQYEVVGNFIEG